MPAAIPSDASARTNAVDPVCGMIPKPDTPHRTRVDGAEILFCSAGCKTTFEADPVRYADAPQPRDSHGRASHAAPPVQHHAPMKAEGAAKGGAQWTCPMHPEIVRDGPGSCPICGMALEPVTPAAAAGPNAELADMTRRFLVGAALAIPVLVLEMGAHFLGLDRLIPVRINPWLQMALATPVVLWAGWPFFERAWASVVNKSLNMFTLIAMGTGVAWAFSVVGTLAPSLFPAEFRTAHGTVAVYFEAAAVITVLVLLGQVLELRARETTSGAIRALLDLTPALARRVRSDGATAIFVGVDGKAAGVIGIADPVKATTPQALAALKEAGLRIIMLTGDNRKTAEAVARKRGIDDVEADILPDRKAAVVMRLKSEGAVVAMAGDGVNDAPALAAADVGIAMGSGTDVAIESAGITLLKGDLNSIVRARALSRATMRNIRQNLFFAFIYNAAGVPIAAGVFYPVFGLLLSPIIAAAAMAASSVSVIGNSLRLRSVRL